MPNKVRIDSVVYSVEEVPPKCGELIDGSNTVCRARIFYEELRIIVGTQPLQRMRQSLVHEINHGIVRERNFKVAGDEEIVVDEMATAWTQILADNPDLVEYLTAPMVMP